MAKDKSPRVEQGKKVAQDFRIKPFEWVEWQKEIIDLMLSKNTKIVFITGPAGTSKTLLAVYAALELIKNKKVSNLLYLRTAIESSSKSLGFLPGEAGDKMAPYLIPLQEKLVELVDKPTCDSLFKNGHIKSNLVNFLRGSSIHSQAVITDEAQNFSDKELITTLSRYGRFSKYFICGDKGQADIGEKSGFSYFCDLFDDQESRDNGIYVIRLTREHVMRSDELKFILEKIENSSRMREKPMFPPK